jgi:DNA-binding NtrC family response regulator
MQPRSAAANAPAGPTRLDELERAHIVRVIESVGGSRTRAAELLGISRSTLKRKLAEWARDGLPVPPAGSD